MEESFVGIFTGIAFCLDRAQFKSANRTFIYTNGTTLAIFNINLDLKFLVGIFTFNIKNRKGFRSAFKFSRVNQFCTDSCVRTNESTLITLNAFVKDPMRYSRGYTAFFKGCCSCRDITINRHIWDRDVIAFFTHDRLDYFSCEIVSIIRDQFCRFGSNFGKFSRYCNLLKSRFSSIDCFPVHLNDILSFFLIGLFNCAFDQFNGFFFRKNSWNNKESCLHNGIYTATESYFFSYFKSIDIIDFNFFINDRFLHIFCKVWKYFISFPIWIQQKNAIIFNTFEHIITSDKRLIMISNKISVFNQIFRLNGRGTKTKMWTGNSTGFFWIVLEVALCIHIGIVTNNLNRVLICTNRTIRTKSPEFCWESAFRKGVELFFYFEWFIWYVVVDSNRKAMESSAINVIVNRFNHWRCKFFGRKTITATNNFNIFIFKSSYNV